MPGQTTERAFETYVEEIFLTTGGWISGSNADWDKERALFPAQAFAFIQETQPNLWEQMKTLHGAGLEPLLLNVGQGIGDQRLPARAAARVQVLRQDISPRLFQTGARQILRCSSCSPRIASPSRDRCPAIPETTARWTSCWRSTACRWRPSS